MTSCVSGNLREKVLAVLEFSNSVSEPPSTLLAEHIYQVKQTFRH